MPWLQGELGNGRRSKGASGAGVTWMGPGARPLAPIQALGPWARYFTPEVSVFASKIRVITTLLAQVTVRIE